MTQRKRRAVVVAAGALVWRERQGRLEVLLIHRPRYDDWSWPKGKLDPGESIPVCAVREVAEETGLQVELGLPLPMLRYRVSGRRTKEVYYWAARELEPGAPALAARPPAQPTQDEVDELRWASPAQALRLLSRKSDRKPLRALVKHFEEGTLDTRALAIVRHARARSRSSWKAGESTRPLTSAGESQAQELVPLLAAFGIQHVESSPWERCVSTVAPFARSAGLEPQLVPSLSEEAHEARPEGARQTFESLVRGGRSAALCTHRPVLPTVLEALDAISPGWVRRSRPRSDPYLRPASVAVAHVLRGKRVVGFEMQTANGRDRKS